MLKITCYKCFLTFKVKEGTNKLKVKCPKCKKSREDYILVAIRKNKYMEEI